MAPPLMRVRHALLHLRPGRTPDTKTETRAAVRGPGLPRGRSPRAQKATSERWFQEKQREEESAGRGPQVCGRKGAPGRPRCLAGFPALGHNPSRPFGLVGFALTPRKIKGKKPFRLQKHFLADDKPHFQWAVRFHISLAAIHTLPFFFFL